MQLSALACFVTLFGFFFPTIYTAGETCTVRLSLMVAGVVRKNNRVCQVSNSRITPDEFKFYFDCAGTLFYFNFVQILLLFWQKLEGATKVHIDSIHVWCDMFLIYNDGCFFFHVFFTEKARVEGKESDKLLTKNQVQTVLYLLFTFVCLFSFCFLDLLRSLMMSWQNLSVHQLLPSMFFYRAILNLHNFIQSTKRCVRCASCFCRTRCSTCTLTRRSRTWSKSPSAWTRARSLNTGEWERKRLNLFFFLFL